MIERLFGAVTLSCEEKPKRFEHDLKNGQDTLQSLCNGAMSLSVPYFNHQVNVKQIGDYLCMTYGMSSSAPPAPSLPKAPNSIAWSL